MRAGARFDRLFVVGMPKTGTKSMEAALARLGWEKVRRDRFNVQPGQFLADVGHRDYWYYDLKYPKAGFILMTRSEDQWADSLRRHLDKINAREVIEDRTAHPMMATLGRLDFDDHYHRALYRHHNESVRAHFRGRDCLLTHDFTRDGYADLCGWLGIDSPGGAWPHEHKGT